MATSCSPNPGAILEYFVEKHGRFVPAPGTPDWRRYRYWMHYAEGSAMPPMLLKLVFDRLEAREGAVLREADRRSPSRTRRRRASSTPQLKLHLDFMEGELAKSAWFAGDDFTAADIQMSFPLEAADGEGRA